VRSETVNRALAGLRLGGGEHNVLAAADGATVSRLTLLTEWAKVGQQHFARFAEIWEVDELVTDDELEAEAAGAELLRT
jgi:DeoR/GlpR family transcriptional regulator of sugar metabolism